MSLTDAVARSLTEGPATVARRTAAETPAYSITGDTGTIVSGVTTDDCPDWDTIFDHWGLKREDWHVDEGTLKVNAWQMPGPDGGDLRIHHQYKANIRRKAHASTNLAELVDLVKKWKKPKIAAKAAPDDGAAFVVNCTDWQIGGEGGTDAAVDRLMRSLDIIEERARRAVKQGATTLLVASVGDIVEGVDGSYHSQTFTVDLDLSAQTRIARHVMMQYLKRLVPLFPTVKVCGIRGNHGQKGKVTTPEDNADLDYIEGVAEVCMESNWGSHISFHFPPHGIQSQILMEAAGTHLLYAHGDEKRGKTSSMLSWWKDTSFTRHADADLASILVLGHRHHLHVEEVAEGRTLMQCPAMDGGSRWFSDIGGGTSRPGVLTFTTRNNEWWDLQVCEPRAVAE